MSKELNNLKLYVDWTQATVRENIISGAKVGQTQGEALATSLGKIAKWFTDIEATGLFDGTANTTYTFTSGTNGSFDVLPSTSGATAQTVRVLPSTTTTDEGKVLMVNASGVPVYTEQAWITKAVADLDNYYLKYNSAGSGDFADKTKATYSASEIDGLLAPKIDVQVVTALPTTDISKTTIYLVPNSSTLTNNTYDEYVYINKGTTETPDWGWEKIGVQEIDLTGYLKAENVTDGDATSGLGTFYVQGNGGSKTAVTVYGLGTAAGKTATTTVASTSTDDQVPTAKAVWDYVDGLDTGISAVQGTTNKIDVTTTSGVATVTLADINTFDGGAATKSVGPSADVTGSEGQTIKVPAITVDKTGRVTAVSEYTLTTKDAKTAQTAISNGSNNLYPILFGNTGAASATNGAITTADETDGVKKTGRLYVQVGSDGVTTVKADIFEGLVATQSIATDNNTMASTAFVHDVVDDAFATSIGDHITGAKGISIAYDSTSGKTVISHSHTDITASTSAEFAKVEYDAQGHLTGTTAVTASDIRGLTPYSGTTNQITLGNDGAFGLADVPTNTTDTKSFVKIHVDAKGRVDATEAVAKSDLTGLIGTLGDSGVTGSALVNVPTTATGKILKDDGTWTDTLATGTKATTLTCAQAIAADDDTVATVGTVENILEDLIVHCTA